MKLILGSSSLGRRQVMDEIGLPYEFMSPDIDEKAIRHDMPEQMVLVIAHAKADALLLKISEPAYLITCDQIVLWNNEVREKPVSEDQARAFIKSYSEFPLIAVGAMVVTNTQTGERVDCIDYVHAWYLPIPDEAIDMLIAKGDVMHVSGAMLAEDPIMSKYMIHMDGTIDSVRGLCKKSLQRLLAEVQS